MRQLRPAEVIDAQADLIARLDDRQFSDMINTMVAQHVSGLPITKDGMPADSKLRHEYDTAIERAAPATPLLRRLTQAAYAYRVTPDMCQMVEYAASQLEDLDRFNPDLAPTGCGIVRFDRGLKVRDIRDKIMRINWLVWGPGEFVVGDHNEPMTGTALWFFNDTWTEPDDIDTHFKAQTIQRYGPERWELYERVKGRWSTVGVSIVSRDQRLGGAQWTPSEEQRKQVEEEGDHAVPGTNSLRYVHALWLLLNQTVTLTEKHDLDRSGRRRAAKKGLPTQVTVVSLRRAVRPNTPAHDSMIEWTHRWIVRGHWAWRVCGRDHPQAQAAPVKGGIGVRVWISPYQKGPDDKPLVVTDKVYTLER